MELIRVDERIQDYSAGDIAESEQARCLRQIKR
jgi:hypothetical protein